MNIKDLKKAKIDQEAVEFSETLAIENPGMYTASEMKGLINRRIDAAAATDEAMRADLASMPLEKQAKMKEMLKSSDVPIEVWKEIFGEGFWSSALSVQLMK